jgi:hypothetical protein
MRTRQLARFVFVCLMLILRLFPDHPIILRNRCILSPTRCLTWLCPSNRRQLQNPVFVPNMNSHTAFPSDVNFF